MEYDQLCKKAADIHAAASHPVMQDLLRIDSIRAEWNQAAGTFTSLAINGVKHHRIYPNLTKAFTIRFLGGDPTDMVSVHKRVANRVAKLDRTGKEKRSPKRT